MKQETIFLSLDTCFSFFMCPCYSARTHCPTLEKASAKSIAFENQGKQCELSDHRKSIKMLFLKKITGVDAKETKRLTEIFHIIQNQI